MQSLDRMNRGDGPESDPLKCKMSRPHGVLAANGVLYVSDSEAHRIRAAQLRKHGARIILHSTNELEKYWR